MAADNRGGAATSEPATSAPEQIATQHVITYGQSLSLGERSVNGYPNDLTIPAGADIGLMFAGGTRPTDLSALVRFAESNRPVDGSLWGIATPGETPLCGALLALKDLPGQRIGSAAGRGGTSIVGLGKGSVPYARLIGQVRAARTLTTGYSVPAVIWMQGESDVGNTAYAAQLQQLVHDLDVDIRAASGQVQPVHFFVCLTAAPGIAQAQRDVAAKVPTVHIACDNSTLAKSDGLHLTATASLRLARRWAAPSPRYFTSATPASRRAVRRGSTRPTHSAMRAATRSCASFSAACATHCAVALKYHDGRIGAPRVVAKGPTCSQWDPRYGHRGQGAGAASPGAGPRPLRSRRCCPKSFWRNSICSPKAGSTRTCNKSTCAGAIPGAG